MKKIKKKHKKKNSKNIYFLVAILLWVGFFLIIPDEYLGRIKETIISNTIQKKQQEPLNDEEITRKEFPYSPKKLKSPSDFLEYKKIKYKYIYTFDFSEKNDKFIFNVTLPESIENVQYIYNEKFIQLKPNKLFYDENMNKVAEYIVKNVEVPQLDIVIEGVAQLRTYDLDTAKRLNKNISVEKNLNRYLQPEKYIESDDTYVKTIAAQVKGANREETVKNIYEYMQNNNFKYILSSEVRGARQVLISRQGKCVDFAAAMVALCRANNIPARIAAGILALNGETGTGHAWVEVYFDEYGWVTFEPTSAGILVNFDQNGNFIDKQQSYIFEKIPTNYIKVGNNIFYNEEWFFSSGQVFMTSKLQTQEI